MRIEFNRTGAERKTLVTAIGEILNVRLRYLGMPTAAYEADGVTIDRNGTVEFADSVENEKIENLLEQLADRGIVAATAEMAHAWLEARERESGTETDNAPAENGGIGLTVTIPLEKAEVGNLTSLLEAKGSLIKKALGVTDLRFTIEGENISFPWFGEVQPDEALAYTRFIAALCDMSRNQKRITAKPRENENEKYAFRCFLLRLGFIGAEYKADRKILLANLDGSSAFKNGQKGGGQQ